MAPLPPEVRALFEGRNFAHVASLMPDGSPHSVPVWVGLEGERITFWTGNPRSRKVRNLLRDPRVALSITDHANPYRMAHVRGHVAETRTGEEALAAMDRMSERYTGKPFPMRTTEGTLFLVEAEHAGFTELPFRHEAAPGGADVAS